MRRRKASISTTARLADRGRASVCHAPPIASMRPSARNHGVHEGRRAVERAGCTFAQPTGLDVLRRSSDRFRPSDSTADGASVPSRQRAVNDRVRRRVHRVRERKFHGVDECVPFVLAIRLRGSTPRDAGFALRRIERRFTVSTPSRQEKKSAAEPDEQPCPAPRSPPVPSPAASALRERSLRRTPGQRSVDCVRRSTVTLPAVRRRPQRGVNQPR